MDMSEKESLFQPGQSVGTDGFEGRQEILSIVSSLENCMGKRYSANYFTLTN